MKQGDGEEDAGHVVGVGLVVRRWHISASCAVVTSLPGAPSAKVVTPRPCTGCRSTPRRAGRSRRRRARASDSTAALRGARRSGRRLEGRFVRTSVVVALASPSTDRRGTRTVVRCVSCSLAWSIAEVGVVERRRAIAWHAGLGASPRRRRSAGAGDRRADDASTRPPSSASSELDGVPPWRALDRRTPCVTVTSARRGRMPSAAPVGGLAGGGVLVEPLRQVQALEDELDGARRWRPATRRRR